MKEPYYAYSTSVLFDTDIEGDKRIIDGDLNDDKRVDVGADEALATCTVDFDDLAILCQQWLDIGLWLTADLDGSYRVDSVDFATLANYWLDDCPAGWPLR